MNNRITIVNRLQPFIGAKLRGEKPGSVDIAYTGARRIDADIRAADADLGITTFWYQGHDFIPWSDIRKVSIHRDGATEVFHASNH